MEGEGRTHREVLRGIARRAMHERGLLTDFSPEVDSQLAGIAEGRSRPFGDGRAKDLRDLPWVSIDNDDTRDIDQLTVAQQAAGDAVRILVAVADVETVVGRDSPIDRHASHNTTSVYTSAEIYPMLPERLSTDLTSLADHADRSAVVVDMTVGRDGSLLASELFPARVRNHAKLAYESVAAWLEGSGPEPRALSDAPAPAENIRLQDQVARALKLRRHEQGALEIETIESHTVFELDQLAGLALERKNRAQEIIEDFMILANSVTAAFLSRSGFPSLRRVVRSPKRWGRICDLAATYGHVLPDEPDPKALAAFLAVRRAEDPLRFPDLSLAVVKLLGAGEYVAEAPDAESLGHFGLAVKDYGHSTAPNRRYPDLVTQRLVKAVLAGQASPYAAAELEALAGHCTRREDDANKVERMVRKAAAALLLEGQQGQRFEAIVTGASPKGTWVRILEPPVEGRVLRGEEGLDVGDRLQVELLHTDVERGYIDFARG
jgi:VacB/RNase II family 3'-5' exoribonuclease